MPTQEPAGTPRPTGRERAHGPDRLALTSLQTLLADIGDAAALLTPDGEVLHVNPAAEILSGHPVEAWEGGNLSHHLPAEEHAVVAKGLDAVAGGGAWKAPTCLITRTNAQIPILLHLRAVPGTPVVLAIFRSLETSGALDETGGGGERVAAALLATARAAALARTAGDLCQSAANAFFTAYPAPIVAVHLLHAPTGTLRLVAAEGVAHAWLERGWVLKLDPASPSLLVRAVLERRTLVEDRAHAVQRFPDIPPREDSPVTGPEVAATLERLGIRTLADTPIEHKGEVFGVIGLATREAFLDAAMVRLLELLAHEIGQGLHRLRLEDARERMHAETRLAYEELADFTYTMSHDVSEQLRRIATLSHIVRDDYRDLVPADGGDMLDRIADITGELQAIVRGSLELTQLFQRAPPVMTALPLAAVVGDALSRVAGEVERTGARVETPERLPEVVGDAELLTLVVEQLLSNALRFNTAPEPRVRLAVQEDREAVEVVVEDNGPGIAEAYREQVFIPFRNSPGDLVPRGTGIGLALAKKAVQRHGGSIWVTDSADLGGAAFHVRIPREPPQV